MQPAMLHSRTSFALEMSHITHRRGDSTWRAYCCSSCNGVVVAKGHSSGSWTVADDVFPETRGAPVELPDTARRYLWEATSTVREAPNASVMVATSAVDAMLKDKGFKDRKKNLHDRIDDAVGGGAADREYG